MSPEKRFFSCDGTWTAYEDLTLWHFNGQFYESFVSVQDNGVFTRYCPLKRQQVCVSVFFIDGDKLLVKPIE